MHDLFLRFSSEKLKQLSGRIEACLAKLDDAQIWWRGAETQNAVGNLVLHLCGNVRQWIISSIGGEADVRQRDQEFAAQGGLDRVALAARLRETVDAAAAVISNLPPDRLSELRRIQNYDVTVLEAIYHVVEHFSEHTGQIVYATKLLTSADLGFYNHLGKAAHGEQVP
jgi:uncharacterized damage-inducible protein DinB